MGSADNHFYAIDAEGRLKWSYRLFDQADALIHVVAYAEDGRPIRLAGLSRSGWGKLWI